MRRREDGFHDLASLFHIIDLGDTLRFNEHEGEADVLTCNAPGVPTDGSNLVVKALNLFRKHTGAWGGEGGSRAPPCARIDCAAPA